MPKNALAELSDKLRLIYAENISNDFYCANIGKAMRIIAELAKVEVYKGCITGNLHIGRGLSERFMVCRKIADEGSKR